MTILTTLLQVAAVWFTCYAMGLFAAKTMLPADIERSYGTLVTPTIGYLTFCLVSFTVSATFKIAAGTASWATMAALAAAGAATQLRASWRIDPRQMVADLTRVVVLTWPMALIVLWPLFVFGADAYLGAVNPDFFAGVLDNHYLLKGHSMATFAVGLSDSHYPIDHTAGHITASGRFGSDLLGIAIGQVLGVDMPTALSLAIGFFLLSLPLTLYFLCRIVLLFDNRTSQLAAWLIGISGPIAMSFLYYYIGQNSGLPALPLLMASCFLMLVRPEWRTLLFCAVMANALFVNYFAMVPYALAPGGVLGIYLLLKRRLSISQASTIIAAFLGITAFLKLGMLQETFSAMRSWMSVIGQSLQGQFFLDFLTESFFPYFFGVYNYPSSPWVTQLFGNYYGRIAGLAVAVVFVGFVVTAFRKWLRANKPADNRVFVLAALVIYTAVWVQYSFAKQYGYAVFKMSSWLQFILVPFIAYGASSAWAAISASSVRQGMPKVIWVLVAGVYAALNIATSSVYANNGRGVNTDSGYIVNHFGMTGNQRYRQLPGEIANFVRPDQSIGMLFSNSIGLLWASYYLKSFPQSFLTHEIMPGDDENLPDVQTNTVVDYYGNVKQVVNEFFHGDTYDQFYLTWGAGDINQDIVAGTFRTKPIWENGTFRLYRAQDSHDMLFTGKGFYRLEYFKPIRDYYFPRVLRWSAEGGEFYLMRPSVPGKPYRLAFDAIVGYEASNDTRTLELWHNGRKFQEVTVTHSARIISEPFYPTAEMNKVVVRIKERNKPIPRSFVLWNRSIPDDYRRMNIAFSNARLIVPGDDGGSQSPATSQRIGFVPLHDVMQEYDGFELDGWMGKSARLKLEVPAAARQMEIEGFIPGNLGFAFPFTLRVKINGREEPHVFPRAGAFHLSLPVKAGDRGADIVLTATESRRLDEEHIRHKVIERSLRFDSITFR